MVPSKCDRVVVQINDLLLFETWGGGGWGDPLDREVDRVALDVKRGLVTVQGAKEYGVIIDAEGAVDMQQTKSLRKDMRSKSAGKSLFDKGGDLSSLKDRCLRETGFPAPISPGI